MKDKIINIDKSQRKKILISVGLVIAVAIIIILIYKLYDRNKVYSAYKVESMMKTDENVDNKYYSYASGALKVSSDGISYIADGKEKWNHGFEIKNPVMDICGNYVAIAEEGSNNISIYNIDGTESKVSASYPIHGIQVSKKGVVAGTLSDDTANYIEVIAKDGTQIAIGRTVLEGDGYPISISLSNDANKIAASYLAVSSGESQTKVVFYNYSEVGQNETDRIVGGYNDFKGTIIPDIEFVNSTTVVGFGDNVIAIYSIKETPSEVKKIKLKKDIKSVIYNSKYIGVVFEGENGDDIEIYNLNGDKILSQKLDFKYSQIKFAEDNILMYNDTDCEIMSVKGIKKFKYKFSTGITSMVPLDDTRYILVSGNSIQQIKLN